MGWTVYSESMTQEEALQECRRLHTWNNEAGRGEWLADGITGSGDNRAYYAALRVTDKAKGETKVVASVCLITLRPFGIKEMGESMGPNVCAAPLAVLQALDPLPPVDMVPCGTCDGTGKLEGERWDERARGQSCHWCDGQGARDRHHYARNWRKRAWARHGGEPQGRQLELLA